VGLAEREYMREPKKQYKSVNDMVWKLSGWRFKIFYFFRGLWRSDK